MRTVLKFWILLNAVMLLGVAAHAASFTASLDRESMVIGQQATLALKFDGVQPSDAPGIPSIPGLRFQYVGPSTAMSIINGATSMSVTFNYVVTASRDGRYTIPALAVNVNGQQFNSDPVNLTVTKPGAISTADMNSGNEIAFVKLVVPKKQIYLGQPVIAQLQLFTRDDVLRWGNAAMNSLPLDGCSAGKIVDQQDQRRQMVIGNRRYTEYPFAIPLTSLRTGQIVVGPLNLSLTLLVASQEQSDDPFIRMFNQGQQQQVSLATDKVTIDCLPLPDKDKPAGFSGAIGDFTMKATAGPAELTVGDPITIHVEISGSGNLDSVTLPLKDGWPNFKCYAPTTKVETSDQFGFAGTKTFEQIISPESTDIHELPALNFSFFNPDDGRYHTLTQAAIPLTIHGAGTTPMPTIAAGKPSTTENQAQQDIVSIRDNLGPLVGVQVPLITRPVFLAAQSLPVLAFLAAFVWRKREDSLANNPRLRRRRAVAQLVSLGLADLKKFAAANNPDEFFALLFRLLQEQLGERLDCPATAITESAVNDLRAKLNAAPATLDSLHELFQLCDQARYAPVRGTSELTSLAGRFEKAVNELQELKA